MPAVSILGTRNQGMEVRQANLSAVLALANILRTSLGPQGGDKMLVDEIGELTITNDGATIMKQLEVEHPAAKLLVELSSLQDSEVGDGTTSVVLLAAELLKRGTELVRRGIHATTVINGYKLAHVRAHEFIKKVMNIRLDDPKQSHHIMTTVATTSLSSKFIGSDSHTFGQLVADAMAQVVHKNSQGRDVYPVSSVNVLKVHGAGVHESKLLSGGYAIPQGRSAQGCPMQVKNARIAFLDFALHKHRMGLGVAIEVSDPAELERIRQNEMDITQKRLQKIIDAGANVVFGSKGIDDMCLKYFVDHGVYAVRRVDRKDLNRLAKATGGRVIMSLASVESDEEIFEKEWLGEAKEVESTTVGDNDFTFVHGVKVASRATTIILRGSNEYQLDEMERSVHDALCAVSKTMESKVVVPGGGAVEAATSCLLEDFASGIGTREQEAVSAFAEALLVSPKTLCMNAGQDAMELVAQLRHAHHKWQHSSASGCCPTGLDLMEGKLRDSVAAGVLEPAVSKLKQLSFATEAAITVLRIDDTIRLKEQGQ